MKKLLTIIMASLALTIITPLCQLTVSAEGSCTSGHTYDSDCDTTCNVCGEKRTTTEGHKKEIYEFENSERYPFGCYEGVYYSTNTYDYSVATATVRALYDGTIEILYSTSTERNYDRLIIKHNDSTIAMASGETDPTWVTAEVEAGDAIYVTYSKDSSMAAGSDTIFFAISTSGISTDYFQATCSEPVICDWCGEIAKQVDHIYSNNCDTTCDICGETRVVQHTYSNACDTTCNVCGAIREIEHSYTNSCDTTCDICGETRTIEHVYSYICDAVCDVCGEVREVEHTYANACDATCDVCGETRIPSEHVYSDRCDSICDVCNETRVIKHEFKETVTKATLKKNGSIVKACKYCGKVTSNTTIKYVKTVKLSTTNYAYNGKQKTPTVVVKDSAGKTLKKNTHYTVTYASGRKNVGTYKVTIKMKGNYSGTKTLTFKVSPTAKSTLTAYRGETKSIGAKSNKKITYTSSNKKVAKVSSKGVITAVGTGKATITVKSGTVSQKITFTVKKPTIAISAPKSSMYIGKTMKLTAKKTPSSAKVTWSVSNKKIATISSSGMLKALSKGTVTVTAKMVYKGYTYKATYKVKVDVEYPDVSVFISTDSKYSSSYVFLITNNGNSSLKVLNQGSVYCYGESERISSLYDGSNFCKSCTVKAGEKSAGLAVILENKMLFLSSKRTCLTIYVTYNGEKFKLYCDSSRYGINKCSTITWIND